jgi:hypothetical protein
MGEEKMSEEKKEGRNVVHKRLQQRGKHPTAKQSQPDTEEIAAQSLGALWIIYEERLRGLGKDSAVKSGLPRLGIPILHSALNTVAI